MADTTRIENIIRALIAKANGTDNAEEAAAFMAKAHDLLEKYQLDLGATLNADDPLEDFPGLDLAASSHKWNRELYRMLGLLYGCKSIRCPYYATDDKGNVIFPLQERFKQRLIGRQSAIMTTQLMYPWVCDQVRAHAKEIAKVTGMSEQGQAKRVGAALVSRIWQMILTERAANKEKPDTVAKNALMTIDAVEAKFAELYPETSQSVSRKTISDAMSRAAAGKIGLNQQAGHSSALRLGSK